MQIENNDDRCCFGTRCLFYDERDSLKSDRWRWIGRGGRGGWNRVTSFVKFCVACMVWFRKAKMNCWGHYMNIEYILLFIAFVSKFHSCKSQLVLHLCFFVAVWCYKAVLFISAAVRVSGIYVCWRIPVTARSKSWVCGRSLAGFADLSRRWSRLSVSCECRGRGLCDWPDTTCRGVVPSVCRWVWSAAKETLSTDDE